MKIMILAGALFFAALLFHPYLFWVRPMPPSLLSLAKGNMLGFSLPSMACSMTSLTAGVQREMEYLIWCWRFLRLKAPPPTPRMPFSVSAVWYCSWPSNEEEEVCGMEFKIYRLRTSQQFFWYHLKNLFL